MALIKLKIPTVVSIPTSTERKYYFDNNAVEDLLLQYIWTGCTTIGLRDRIMEHAGELIRQIIMTHNLHRIYPGQEESAFGDLFQTAWCVDPASIIISDDGMVRVGAIAQSSPDSTTVTEYSNLKVWSIDGLKPVTSCVSLPTTPVQTTITDHGYQLTTTDDHPFLVLSDTGIIRKPQRDLSIGDLIPIQYSQLTFGQYKATPTEINTAIKSIEEHGVLPPYPLSWRQSSIASLLNKLFKAHAKIKKNGRITLTIKSPVLTNQLRTILLNFGIISHTVTTDSHQVLALSRYYSGLFNHLIAHQPAVNVHYNSDQSNLLDVITTDKLHKHVGNISHAKLAALGILKSKLIRHRQVAPITLSKIVNTFKITDQFLLDRLRERSSTVKIQWQPIVEMLSHEAIPVVDISVPESKTFTANGIVTGNCQIEKTLYKYKAKPHCNSCYNINRPRDSILYEPANNEYGILEPKQIAKLRLKCPTCAKMPSHILYRGSSKVFNLWCVRPDTTMFTSNGIDIIDNIANRNGYSDREEIWTFGEHGPCRVTAGISKPTTAVLDIKTKLGYSIGCTPEHSFKTMGKDGQEWRTAGTIKPGDRLGIQYNQQFGGVQSELSSEHHIDQFRMSMLNKGVLTELTDDKRLICLSPTSVDCLRTTSNGSVWTIWLPVISITPSVSEVREISVNSIDHSYIANGFISHNSQVSRTVILAYIKKENRDRKNAITYRDHLDTRTTPIADAFLRFLDEAERVCKDNLQYQKILNALKYIAVSDDRPYDSLVSKLVEHSQLSRAIISEFLKMIRTDCVEASQYEERRQKLQLTDDQDDDTED